MVTSGSSSLADAAMARVLAAERQAHDDIVSAQAEAVRRADAARAEVRAIAERVERRVRALTAAFERERAARVAAIDAETKLLDAPAPLTEDELRALQRAVAALAQQLVGAAP